MIYNLPPGGYLDTGHTIVCSITVEDMFPFYSFDVIYNTNLSDYFTYNQIYETDESLESYTVLAIGKGLIPRKNFTHQKVYFIV